MSIFNQVCPKENWTPLEGYKYKSSDPHLENHHGAFFYLFLGFGSHKYKAGLRRIGSHKGEIIGFEAHISILGF